MDKFYEITKTQLCATFFQQIILKRKPLFYVVNVIFPSTILMIMDTIGFFIPPESGERISFKITLLLGYSVFLVIASETLPAIGAPLIGKFRCLGYYTVRKKKHYNSVIVPQMWAKHQCGAPPFCQESLCVILAHGAGLFS